MIFKSKCVIIAMCITTFSLNSILAQKKTLRTDLVQKDTISENTRLWNTLVFFDYRGINTIDIAVGGSKTTGDLPDSEFALYYKLGYKYFIKDHFNVNMTYHNYYVAFGDVYNERFTSIDFNFEYFVAPYTRFSPFVQAGIGSNFQNKSKNSSFKFQWTLGVEYIVTDGIGIKLFGEHNTNFSDELDGLSEGNTNDLAIRLGCGINFYFGGKKRKAERLSRIKTVIKSNLLE